MLCPLVVGVYSLLQMPSMLAMYTRNGAHWVWRVVWGTWWLVCRSGCAAKIHASSLHSVTLVMHALRLHLRRPRRLEHRGHFPSLPMLVDRRLGR